MNLLTIGVKLKKIYDQMIKDDGINIPSNLSIKKKGNQIQLTLSFQIPEKIDLTSPEEENTKEETHP